MPLQEWELKGKLLRAFQSSDESAQMTIVAEIAAQVICDINRIANALQDIADRMPTQVG